MTDDDRVLWVMAARSPAVVGIALLSAVAIASSAPSATPRGAWPRSIALATAGERTVLLAAHVDGVSISRDGARTWRRGRGLEAAPFFTHVAVSPVRPGNVYAATSTASDAGRSHSGVFVSTDGGRSWRRAGLVLSGTFVATLVVAPSQPSTVYAGTNHGLFKSTTRGRVWRKLSLPPGLVTGLAADPERPKHLYATVEGQGVFRSTDGGRRWNGAMTPARYGGYVATIAFEPLIRGGVYAGTADGIYHRVRGGPWRRIDGGLMQGNRRVHDFAFDTRNAGTMYAVTYCAGLFKSRDAGRTWRRINRGFVEPCRPPFSVAVDPLDSSVLYALTPGTGLGLYKSTDAGSSWRRTSQP
jgi:photosystem II stability/assembly factor-like uncharacterized protein